MVGCVCLGLHLFNGHCSFVLFGMVEACWGCSHAHCFWEMVQLLGGGAGGADLLQPLLPFSLFPLPTILPV